MAIGIRALLAVLCTGCFLDATGLGDHAGDTSSTGSSTGGQSAGGQSAGGEAAGGESAAGAGAPGGGGQASGGSSADGGTGGSGGAPPACTEVTIWQPSATPAFADFMDPDPVEVGVKFRSDVTGTIRAIRYYKGSENSGTHVGHLWSASGQLLGTTTFTGESISGWQQADFEPPVVVAAGTTYVASYHSPNGYYAADDGYFLQAGADNAPLHALQDGVDGENAIFVHGPSGTFPNDSYNGTNYWVDVVLCH